MSKAKHTPGPWRVENNTEQVGPYTSAALEIWSNNRHITTVNEHVDDLAIDQANAALIAAAPEMFEALEALIESGICGVNSSIPLRVQKQVCDVLNKINDSAKAKGA